MKIDAAKISKKVRALFEEDKVYSFRMLSVKFDDSKKEWVAECSFFPSLTAENPDIYEIILDEEGDVKRYARK